MLPKGKIININQACVNCKHPEEINNAQSDMVLYRCNLLVDRNPVFLDEKACLLWSPIVANFALKLIIRKEYRLYVCIDEDENIWAYAKNESNCLIKALNNIRLAFLIEKRQLDLFYDDKEGNSPMLIKISEIKIGKRMRKLDENKVNELAQSISESGLINPITINEQKELLAGAHRIEAVKRLGFDSITAEVKNNIMKHGLNKGLYDALIEIDENLLGPQLTALERADFLKERKRIYEILHPETKQGQSQASAMNKSEDDNVTAETAVTFTKDASEKVGLAERTIREDVQLSKSLCGEARKVIVGSWIEDKKTYLVEIGRLCPESQVKVATRLVEFPALSLDWAIKKIEAERYGFHLTPTYLIDLQKSTLHLYNSGLPIEEQKRVINLVANRSYPPFVMDDLYRISDKQDHLVNEVLAIAKNQEDSTRQLTEKELEDVKLSNDLCAKAKEVIAGSILENKKSYLIEIAKLLGYQQVSMAEMLIANPEWGILIAKKHVFSLEYGFKLSKFHHIILQESTLHEWNNGLPVEKQKEIIRGIFNRKYPPFELMDLQLISKEQDELVDEIEISLGLMNPKIDKKQDKPKDAAESMSPDMQKELIDLNITMPNRNDKKIVPVLILPDGNKRILSHLADDKFPSALVNKEMLDRVDICLGDNDAILIRRIGNLVSVSKASIDSKRFIDEINKSFEQIK